MDETSGSTAHDQTTSPANGTYSSSGVTLGQTGAITTSTDYAPGFDGSTGYMSVPSTSKLQPSKSLTLEAWFKTSASGSTEPILSTGGSSGAQLYLTGAGKLDGFVGSHGILTTNSYNDGAWHYAVVTWDGSSISLYVDGALAAPANSNPLPQTTAPTYSSTGVFVGENYVGNAHFSGSIDEPAIYGSSTDSSAALKPGVIKNHYAAATSGLTKTPINVVAPTVTGRPLVGSTFSVSDNGSWNESTEIYGSLSFAYQWLQCGYDGTGCTSISGATSSSYTVASADNLHALAVKVTASNSGGSTSVTVNLPTIGGYRTAVFTDGGSNLHGYWPLDDTYSYPYLQTAADISDSPAAATYQSGVTLKQPGPIVDGSDIAATFNGSASGYASTASVSKVEPTKSLTVEAWFKTTASGGLQPIVWIGQSFGVQLYLTSSGKLDGIINNTGVLTTTSYNDGAWHYAALTWNGSFITLYVDGAIAPTATGVGNPKAQTTAPSYGSTGLFIGNNFNNSQFFNGSIDEVSLDGSSTDTTAALTGAQVQNHYVLRSYQALLQSETTGGTNDSDPGLNCGCTGSAGDPVNLATGDFFESATDVSVKSYGPSVSFTRTYDAALAQQQAKTATPGGLGYGWTDNWNMSLNDGGGVVTVTQDDGAQVNFYPPVSGACSAPYVGPGTTGTYCARPDVTASLTYNSGTSKYTFVTHPYESYTFNSSGQLTAEAGPGGASLTVAYNSPSPGSGSCPSTATSCSTITSASGRALVLANNSSGEVTKVVDPLGRAWTYAYCAPPSSTCSTGDLLSVTDPMSRVTSYTYDEPNSNANLKHDLLTITKPNGQTGGPDAGDKTVNVYDSSGRVTSQTDPSGWQTTLDYSHLSSGSASGYVIATDPDGNETKTSYQNGIITGSIQGYGLSSASTTTFEPDPSTLLDTTVVDPNGNPSEYSYSGAGDVTSSTDQLSHTTSYSYNSFDEVTCAATPVAASACSSLSPPAAITPGGTITPPTSAPPKYVTYNEYDTSGNLVWTTQGDYAPGNSTASQQRTIYNLSNGESVTIGGNTDSCTTSAPSTALPCATIDPNGVVTQLQYNSSGDLTSSSKPDGNPGGEVAQTTYGYDGDGEQTSTTAPDGNVSGANAADYTTTTTYDNNGEVTSVTVGHTGGSYTARTTSYGYDGDGNKTSVINARTKTTTYTFNADDQLTLVTDPDNQSTLTCYDGAGNVTETVPPVGVAANSLTAGSCPTTYPSAYGDRLAGDSTTFAYDALGDKTTMTTPAPAGQMGYETTTYSYNNDGQLTTLTAPPTSDTSGAPNDVTSYTYDDAGRTLTMTVGSGTSAASTTSYCYDPNGEGTAVVPPDGNSSGVASCSTSSPYQTTSPDETGYSYDSLGEIVSLTRPATTWATSGQITSYSYDPAGNALTTSDPNGVTTTSTYTPLNQIASVSYSGSAAHSVTYSYDANGNRLSMIDGTGTSTYTYDPFGELTSYENGAAETVSYAYNDDGKTIGITYPLGAGATWAATDTVTYAYDNADELNSVTDFNNNTITIGNTADGLPNSETLASTGDTITTTYDPTDEPSQITLASSSSTLLQFAYSDVPSGAINSETDTPTWTGSPAAYTYDAQSRITQMTSGSSSALDYGFDASGDLTTLPTGATGTYDNAGELTSSTSSGVATTYTYDADGERTQATQGGSVIVSAAYNGAQALTSYSDAFANMSAAAYDGDGLRQRATITPSGGSAATQDFTWGTNGGTPHLLLDSTNAYIYDSGNTPVEQFDLNSGVAHYLATDALGSVRGVVDATGSLVASTEYDAWGNLLGVDLGAYTPFGYAGGYVDPTGLVYLIHRYYDPETGQFLSIDPLADQTQIAYGYANNDPVDQVDPAGLCATTGTGQSQETAETEVTATPTSPYTAYVRGTVKVDVFNNRAELVDVYQVYIDASGSINGRQVFVAFSTNPGLASLVGLDWSTVPNGNVDGPPVMMNPPDRLHLRFYFPQNGLFLLTLAPLYSIDRSDDPAKLRVPFLVKCTHKGCVFKG
jgi:RHS repeat-associated protein